MRILPGFDFPLEAGVPPLQPTKSPERSVVTCPECGDRLYDAGPGMLGCIRCFLLWMAKPMARKKRERR